MASGRGKLPRRRIYHLDEGFGTGPRIHRLSEELGRQVEIDAAGTARAGRANGARHADSDIGRMQHAEGGLAERFGDGELVHLLIVALLQIDDLALGRTGYQDHREAVGGGVCQRGQTVEKTRSRHGEADAGLFRQIAGDRGGVSGVLFMPERDDAHTGALRKPPEIGDRDARHTIDRVDAVEFQRIDDEVKAIR